MQAHYPFEFEREMGCTEDELRAWLPGASRGRVIDWRDRGASMALDQGRVTLQWQALPPRRIALISLPRLWVRFEARDVDEGVWREFMRHFDLHTLRGGG
jgi:hypothetical protein